MKITMAERSRTQQTGSQVGGSDMAQVRHTATTPLAALNTIIEMTEHMSQQTMHVESGDEAALLGMHIQHVKAQAEKMITALKEVEVSTGTESEESKDKDE